MKLIICGNGFDMQHSLRTGYSDYQKNGFLNGSRVATDFVKFPWLKKSCKSNCWRNIEESLTIDIPELVKYIKEFYVEPDGSLASIELETDIDEWTDFIYSFTGDAFFKWLMQVDVKSAHRDPMLEPFFDDAVFVNFNYTSTLEDVYHIPPSQVLHLHGSLRNIDCSGLLSGDFLPSFNTIEDAECRADEVVRSDIHNSGIIRHEIQFGSPFVRRGDLETALISAFGLDAVQNEKVFHKLLDFIDCAAKDIPHNIPSLNHFLEKKKITEVVVMGQSLGGPDDYYYKNVFLPNYRSLQWTFFCYSPDDKGEKETFALRNGIKNARYCKW